MLKKLLELETQLQAERETIATEIQTLQAIVDQPEPVAFDELSAASRIMKAKTADHFDGSQTAEAIAKAIDKERSDSAKQFAATAKQKSEARQKHAAKYAQLTAIDSELATIAWQIKGFIQQEAQTVLQGRTEDYRAAAVALLNALVDIDALNAIIADAPNENPAKWVLQLKTLPKVGIDQNAEVKPWQIQAHSEKLIFTSDTALPVVNRRYLDLIEDIKGTLYAQ